MEQRTNTHLPCYSFKALPRNLKYGNFEKKNRKDSCTSWVPWICHLTNHDTQWTSWPVQCFSFKAFTEIQVVFSSSPYDSERFWLKMGILWAQGFEAWKDLPWIFPKNDSDILWSQLNLTSTPSQAVSRCWMYIRIYMCGTKIVLQGSH